MSADNLDYSHVAFFDDDGSKRPIVRQLERVLKGVTIPQVVNVGIGGSKLQLTEVMVDAGHRVCLFANAEKPFKEVADLIGDQITGQALLDLESLYVEAVVTFSQLRST